MTPLTKLTRVGPRCLLSGISLGAMIAVVPVAAQEAADPLRNSPIDSHSRPLTALSLKEQLAFIVISLRHDVIEGRKRAPAVYSAVRAVGFPVSPKGMRMKFAESAGGKMTARTIQDKTKQRPCAKGMGYGTKYT